MPTLRREPYVWTTWITGLLSGDKHCRWAPWFRSHYTYAKTETDFNLFKWKGEHADFVRDIATRMRADGWQLFLEDQNKFRLKGQRGMFAGVADIVAMRPGFVKVVDGKTGKRRDSDVWQVLIYLAELPLGSPLMIAGQQLDGEVVYRDGAQHVENPDQSMTDRIWATVREASGDDEPERTPSPSECAHCDILDCPDRMEPVQKEVAAGGLF